MAPPDGSIRVAHRGGELSAGSDINVSQFAEKAGNVKTVLIADDEASLRLLVSATLEWEECKVIEAADGDEAWDLVRTERPTLAILDVTMPGRSGIELAQAIKGDPDLRATKVVLLTAKAQEQDRQAGLAAGADLYLTKPFSPLELLSVVEQALEGS
jgi:CheY-like chemotaxis protein